MKKDRLFIFIIVILFLTASITAFFSMWANYLMYRDYNAKLDELQSSNEILMKQNKEFESRLYKYDMLHSETDAAIADMSADIENLEFYRDMQIEKEVNETESLESSAPEGEIKGTYELTAYIATGNPCADGVYPQSNHTAACNDPDLWHKWIYIEGYGTYYVHDRGGMSSSVIDIFVDSYDEAVQFGRRSATVSIIE